MDPDQSSSQGNTPRKLTLNQLSSPFLDKSGSSFRESTTEEESQDSVSRDKVRAEMIVSKGGLSGHT
jgi:hypothetical protein